MQSATGFNLKCLAAKDNRIGADGLLGNPGWATGNGASYLLYATLLSLSVSEDLLIPLTYYTY